ncbi:deoxyhypusine synthase [Nematocida sp. LUAm3]|nr:deoxyhypusine synthase [Nematocida ausubeli]KAI5173257.1 deoxyhypusine synthase [Nematocida sp. LUAm3]KAI5176424.1 deoxyhypusine synthase [Nematocida sp. LUAm2]KAI5179293.1 deoxyhypusine synthase [Nematocida sp. LUAm1]
MEEKKSSTPAQSREEKKSVKDLADEEAQNTSAEVESMEIVSGKDFPSLDLSAWCTGYRAVGFQGTNLFRAIEELKVMRRNKSKIFLGFTSNLVSSGLRDILCHLVKNSYVDVIVCTAGGVEEDLIKALKPSRLGEFSMDGASLRAQGLNRVGNVLIPNENYTAFEPWMNSFLHSLLENTEELIEENKKREGFRMLEDCAVITPSRMIYEMGKRIGKEDSFCYWAHRNNIPVYCPGITDGSIGDMLTFFKERKRIIIDVSEDIAQINNESPFAHSTGALILGAGIVKHHILNANLFRNGLEHCVLVNTAQEYDGSDAGARIDESISWGKIKKNTKSVKVHADATIVLPIIVSAVWPESLL